VGYCWSSSMPTRRANASSLSSASASGSPVIQSWSVMPPSWQSAAGRPAQPSGPELVDAGAPQDRARPAGQEPQSVGSRDPAQVVDGVLGAAALEDELPGRLDVADPVHVGAVREAERDAHGPGGVVAVREREDRGAVLAPAAPADVADDGYRADARRDAKHHGVEEAPVAAG